MNYGRLFSGNGWVSVIAWVSLCMMTSCSARQENWLRAGWWRGEFKLQSQSVPVLFEVTSDSTHVYADFVNGQERARFTVAETSRDSTVVSFDLYESSLIFSVHGSRLEGFYRKNNGNDRGVPFTAVYDQQQRFRLSGNDSGKLLAGSWDVDIIADGKPANHSVGIFEQVGNTVTGTLMTVTGDYRYFEGIVDGEQILLSAFSGSSPRLINGKFVDSVRFEADLITPGGVTRLIGQRNDRAALPDPYTLTFLKNSNEKFDFTFPDLTSHPVSLHDSKFKGKVVLITIQGTWCPNCIDEAEFLSRWYDLNKDRGVEVIGLSFERKDDFSWAKPRIERFRDKFGIAYDLLFAGSSNKEEASRKLPQLNAVLSYPTTIFVDRKGTVRKIHTGFTGPATGRYYQQFVEEFEKTVNDLLTEPAI